MTRRRAIVAVVLLTALVVAGAVAVIRRRAFADQIDREIADLLATGGPLPQATVEAVDLRKQPAKPRKDGRRS